MSEQAMKIRRIDRDSWKVSSRSRSGLWHTVRTLRDSGAWNCSCEDYTFKGFVRYCEHIKAVRAAVQPVQPKKEGEETEGSYVTDTHGVPGGGGKASDETLRLMFGDGPLGGEWRK